MTEELPQTAEIPSIFGRLRRVGGVVSCAA